MATDVPVVFFNVLAVKFLSSGFLRVKSWHRSRTSCKSNLYWLELAGLKRWHTLPPAFLGFPSLVGIMGEQTKACGAEGQVWKQKLPDS